MLFGRFAEREALNSLLAAAREGLSATMVLRGDAGVGKTALLDDMVATATAEGIQSVRLTGVESETQFGYAALHRLLLPFPDYLDRLPDGQREALRSTFGLVAGPPADRFLVALGLLTLLSDVASDAPLLSVVDDVQWLDPESALVLGFVARRLQAEQVVMVLAVRDHSEQSSALMGLPEMVIGGLGHAEAVELLTSLTGESLSPHVGAHLVAETEGNPLGLVELVKELSPAQLVGSVALPDPLPVGRSLQLLFSRRVNRLRPDARLLLALAATESTAPRHTLWRAAERCSIDPLAAASEIGDLVEFTHEVVFSHPLVRLVAYQLTPPWQRRLIHQVLADVGDGQRADRVAWHLGMAAIGPDDAVAARLEQAAEQARHRGGYAATVTFLSRAAELSVDDALRPRRLLGAAEAALRAGQYVQAGALLDQAREGPLTELQAGIALRLSGEINITTGQMAGAFSQFLAAARALMPIDSTLGRQTLLRALEAATYAGRSAVDETRKLAAEVLSATSRAILPSSIPDRLLFGLLWRLVGNYGEAAPLLNSAVAELRDETISDELRLPWMGIGSWTKGDLLDDEAKTGLAVEFVRLARRRGALMLLLVALVSLADVRLREGRFDLADEAHAEFVQIAPATGNPGLIGWADSIEISVLAWRGRQVEARKLAAKLIAETSKRGPDASLSFVHIRLALLGLGLRNYRSALGHARYVYDEDLSWGTHILPDLIEAATRCGEAGVARMALERLAGRAQASGAPWGLGLLARSRALVAPDEHAEAFYQEAIALLGSTRSLTDLARAHLLYGEWLRRQRRRRDARTPLRIAYDMLAGMGAQAFAERARIELQATGEQARKRSVDTLRDLTAQEAQIAQFVSVGETNRDIAGHLFISPYTVEYHLRKIYRKLGVSSRTQLTRTMLAVRPPP